MVFVPVVPPQPPSPRTRELADLLTRVIAEYEKHHPSVSRAEVQAAVEMARPSSGTAGPVAAVLVGVLAAVFMVGLFVYKATGGRPADDSINLNLAIAVAVLILLIALVLKRLSGK